LLAILVLALSSASLVNSVRRGDPPAESNRGAHALDRLLAVSVPLAAVRDRGRRVRARRALLVNHTAYLTPIMNWTRSGELMFMVILADGSIAGPVLGAFALLLVEDALSLDAALAAESSGPLLVLSCFPQARPRGTALRQE